MRFDPARLLAANAALQVLFSSVLGVCMLIPMQPWGKHLAGRVNMKALLAAHLDWLMLAFMQWGAAFIMSVWPSTSSWAPAILLVFGGWTNPTAYVFRAVGINAFAFTGGAGQRAAAAIGGLSSLAIIAAWGVVCWRIVLLRD